MTQGRESCHYQLPVQSSLYRYKLFWGNKKTIECTNESVKVNHFNADANLS